MQSLPPSLQRSPQLPIKMEVEAHHVKEEAFDDFAVGHSFDNDCGDDDNSASLDDSYLTGGTCVPGERMPFVKLTAIEDDPNLNMQYSDQINSPPKKKRGRPRKSDSAAGRSMESVQIKQVLYTDQIPKRGRPPKKVASSPSNTIKVVGSSPSARPRGRPRKGASSSSAGPEKRMMSLIRQGGGTVVKETAALKPKDGNRSQLINKKRSAETVVSVTASGIKSGVGDKQCDSCGKVLKLSALLAVHRRIKHHRRTYYHRLHRKVKNWNMRCQVVVQKDYGSDRKVFGCKRCGEMFHMWTTWKRHNFTKHVGRHQCIKCKAEFSYPLDLNHHRHRKHGSKLVLKKR